MTDSLGSTILGALLSFLALDVVLKATALYASAFACHFALGRWRALVRFALWNACLNRFLLLPADWLAFPRLALTLLIVAHAGVLGSVELARAAVQAGDQPAKTANEPQAATGSSPPNTIDVIVRAKDTGKPLESASVRPLIERETMVRKTDQNGRVRIILFRHSTRDTLNIDVWAEGYVQQRHNFAQHDARYSKIPTEVTFELLRGEQTLGGTVTDEQGRPIRGVKVEVWGYLGEKKHKDELAYHVDASTDHKGQWRCRCFRSMKFAYLYLSHPDYLADDWHARKHGRPLPSNPPDADEKPMEGLRDFSDVQVMTRGIELTGQVLNEDGTPIPNAEVGWLEAERHDLFHRFMPTTTTDAKGRFQFPHTRPAALVLQVKAIGYAPELKSVLAKQKVEPITIQLGPPRTLRGRVVNSQGRPIFGALIVIDTWRTYRSLGVYIESDADGRFEWQHAPPDMVLMNASATGFDSVMQRRVSPGEEPIFMLKRSLVISGRVRNANTKNPINNVTVDFGTPGPKPGSFSWARNSRASAHQGRLQASVDIEQWPVFRLRFRADGYEPFESRTFRSDEQQQVEYDVELTPTDTKTRDTR